MSEAAPPVTGKAAGKGKAPHAPPVAPGKAAQGKGLGKNGKASASLDAEGTPAGPKMRPLFLATAQAQPESVWKEYVPQAFDDFKGILQSHFAVSEKKADITRKLSADDDSRKRIRVLDDSTTRNLTIQFQMLPPPERLACMLDTLEGFPDTLPERAVSALNMAATKHSMEVQKVNDLNVKGCDLEKLDMPERYLWVLGSVPSAPIKVASGAFLVDLAQELDGIESHAKVLHTGCVALRESELLKKCIFVCRSLGDYINHGTARAGKPLVLPDALLKASCYRSNEHADGAATSKSCSLLDIIVEVAVKDSHEGAPSLSLEMWKLFRTVSAARGVAIDEEEKSSRKICAEGQRVEGGLREVSPRTDGVERILERVAKVNARAANVSSSVVEAMGDLATTTKWSNASTNQKNEEFLQGWCKCLEELAQAFTSFPVRPRDTLRMEPANAAAPDSSTVVSTPQVASVSSQSIEPSASFGMSKPSSASPLEPPEACKPSAEKLTSKTQLDQQTLLSSRTIASISPKSSLFGTPTASKPSTCQDMSGMNPDQSTTVSVPRVTSTRDVGQPTSRTQVGQQATRVLTSVPKVDKVSAASVFGLPTSLDSQSESIVGNKQPALQPLDPNVPSVQRKVAVETQEEKKNRREATFRALLRGPENA